MTRLAQIETDVRRNLTRIIYDMEEPYDIKLRRAQKAVELLREAVEVQKRIDALNRTIAQTLRQI